MRPSLAVASFALGLGLALPPAGAADPLPRVAEGWKIGRVVEAPSIAYPTGVVVAPGGTIYLGQDPMDMPGPPTVPADSVVAIRDGAVATFADGLWSVMGLEWLDGTLFVVHAPFLSAFRDDDGDGRADSRVDLVTGLGPKVPGFNGINDHVASGLRLGIDGYLYVAVGDKGIPRGVGRDGATISMASGGVIRVRPDGTGLEVVSTGERNPLSVALTAADDVFTYGNDDDSKKWPNSLTHHVVGGHFGYPYDFLLAPHRALPIVAGWLGGSGAQGICYNEDGLPDRYRGNLFFCDWGLQAVHRYEVAKAGGTFRLARREPLVEKGDLADFRPFAIAAEPDGSSFLLVDWAFNGWLSPGPKTGRLFRLTYEGADRVIRTPGFPLAGSAARTSISGPIGEVRAADPARVKAGSRGTAGPDLAARVASLDHPALAVRLESQRLLAAKGSGAVGPLAARLGRRDGSTGRVHALWALDAIGTPEARRAIRPAMADADPSVRLQAARSSGVRRDREAGPSLVAALRDPDPAVRREAAIALGRLGDASAGPALMAALGDADAFAAWSIRRAIRDLGAWDAAALTAALADPRRREDALKLADESWAVPAVAALATSLAASADPSWKARLVGALGGLYHRYPAWSGRWFGTNPLAGALPRKTEDWAREGMDGVLLALARALRDGDAAVRRQAIIGLIGVGTRAAPLLRAALDSEADPVNLAALATTLGNWADARAVPALAKLLGDPARPVEARASALDALASLGGRPAMNARLGVLYAAAAPAELVARALPGLGRARALPPNDLAAFLDHKAEAVRSAALASFPADRPLPAGVPLAFVDRLDDRSPVVREAAVAASGRHRLRDAIPRLVALAEDDSTRAGATRALAEMPDARAIPAFIAALGDRDPEARRAAESALIALRDVAAPELESRARAGRFVGPVALAVERVLTRFAPVVAWHAIGPFPRATQPLFPAAAAIDLGRAEVGAEGRKVAWRPLKGDPATGRVLLDDLKAGGGGGGGAGGFGYDAGGSPDLAAFALAEIPSDRDRPALLLVGSGGSILVAVNDRPVHHAPNGGRPYASDSDLVRVALRKGTNRVLVQARQGIGPWSFGVQVSEPSSAPLAAQAGAIGREGLRAFALSHPGDPRNGEALFLDPGKTQCARCHAPGTAGLGPDLAGLALKYDKAEIVRSVLDPSARIAIGYQPVLIARADGTVLSGHLRAESDADLELIDAEARVVRVPKAEVRERRAGDVSLMPAGLVDGLSPVEFADLVAYLTGLKSAERPGTP